MPKRARVAARRKHTTDNAETQRAWQEQAAATHAEVAAALSAVTAQALAPTDTPRPDHLAAELARLELASATAQLLRALLDEQNSCRADTLGERVQALLRDWRRARDSGSWEARLVWQPRLVTRRDPDNGQVTCTLVLRPFGPYYYRLWRADGRQQRLYFGRARPADFPTEADIVELPTEDAPLRLADLRHSLAFRTSLPRDSARSAGAIVLATVCYADELCRRRDALAESLRRHAAGESVEALPGTYRQSESPLQYGDADALATLGVALLHKLAEVPLWGADAGHAASVSRLLDELDTSLRQAEDQLGALAAQCQRTGVSPQASIAATQIDGDRQNELIATLAARGGRAVRRFIDAIGR